MIFVGGAAFVRHSSSSERNGNEVLAALLEDPVIVSAANLFKATPERKFSLFEGIVSDNSPQPRHVYVFQREYATVDPSLVELAGTDEATTCVGVIIRNLKNGKTSVAHMDSPKIVDMGLTQMLSSVIDDMDDQFDVHLIGGFEDTPSVVGRGSSILSFRASHSVATSKMEGKGKHSTYSFPLCSKIIEALQNRQEIFHVQMLFILGHNTKRDSDGNTYPIVNGFLVETSSGSVRPASFDSTTRGPDEIARRVRVTVSFMDPAWNGKLLETYDTWNDRFLIAPCSWSQRWRDFAASQQQFSDSRILQECSTSPLAEGPDFVKNQRRVFDHLIRHPDWRETFPLGKSRIFERTPDGRWRFCQ